jgi:hypothetical protein
LLPRVLCKECELNVLRPFHSLLDVKSMPIMMLHEGGDDAIELLSEFVSEFSRDDRCSVVLFGDEQVVFKMSSRFNSARSSSKVLLNKKVLFFILEMRPFYLF